MPAAVSFYTENITFSLKRKKIISSWLQEIITSEHKIPKEITIIFCDDTYLLEINKKFLNHDTFTDIVTFDYNVKDEISGDIFISIDRVGENAEKFGKQFSDELCRVMCHGILHLSGYSDKTKSEKLEMRAKEDHYLLILYRSLNISYICKNT